jgi:hypothetical protein
MATLTLEKELTECERQYWQAMKERDIDKAVELTEFPCLMTGSHGVMRVDKQSFIKMMKSPRQTVRSAELSNVTVQRLSEDVAVVAYQVKEELTVDGKAVTLNATDSSTWIRRDGHWACAAHTESMASDTHGRDQEKKAAS